jgi:hypothetical protein
MAIPIRRRRSRNVTRGLMVVAVVVISSSGCDEGQDAVSSCAAYLLLRDKRMAGPGRKHESANPNVAAAFVPR